MKRKIAMLTIAFALTAALMLYLFFANINNNKLALELTAEYAANISEIEEEDLSEEYEAAVRYNSSYEGDYDSLLNVNGDGMMGYIVIPKIDVNLPIYHYVTDEILDKGIGHIETTSLPVAGTSSHCVLSGHRGIPGSKLFTDLDQMEIGDTFYLVILDRTLEYEVTSIEVVLPTEVDSLAVVSGKELCTLVTCTPYGINTHRLLVTGEFVGYVEEVEETAEVITAADVFSPDYILLYIVVAETVFYVLIVYKMRKKANRITKIS